MNKDTLEGDWRQLKGKIKEKWGQLTDDDMTQINGKKDILLGKIQSRYGYAKERAEKELADFERSCDSCQSKEHKSHAGTKSRS